MIRFELFFAFFIFAAQFVTAQTILTTQLFKNNGTEVNDPDSADFVRMVESPDSGSKMLIIREFYAGGSRKSLANSISLIPLQYEGPYISFHPNGKKKEISKYHDGYLIDTTYNFYPNGQLYTAKYEIPPFEQSTDIAVGPNFYIKSMRDSTGKDIVVDGKGNGIIYSDDYKIIVESGEIKNGIREGIWTGQLKSLNLKYTEIFSKGRLISGESIEIDGKVNHYTQDQVQPVFKGGPQFLYDYLRKNVRYPPSAQERNIQGKVFVRFIILEDGTLTEIRSTRSPDKVLTEEALRVIKNSSPWEPGQLKGKKVKVAYNVPVSFTLSN